MFYRPKAARRQWLKKKNIASYSTVTSGEEEKPDFVKGMKMQAQTNLNSQKKVFMRTSTAVDH